MEESMFLNSLPAQASPASLRASSDRGRFIGVLAPWCGACHRVRPFFIECIRASSAWHEYNGLDMQWINGDHNELDTLRDVGIDPDGFPTFFMRLPHARTWTRVQTSVLATPESLRTYWLQQQQDSIAELEDRLSQARHISHEITKDQWIQHGEERLMRPTLPYLFVPRIVASRRNSSRQV